MTSEVGKFDGIPLVGGQDPKGFAHLLGQRVVPDLVFDVGSCIRRQPGFPLLPSSPRGFGSQEINASAMSVCQKERSQRAPVGVEPLGTVPELEEHLLNYLFREGGISENPECQAVDRSGMTPVSLRQRLLLPASDRDDQSGIARFSMVVEVVHLLFIRNGEALGIRIGY